jgi:transposase, IS5 family
MAWKNLQQLSLADSLTSEHDALTELDDINELMDWEAIEHLLGDIYAKHRGNSATPALGAQSSECSGF